MTSYLELGNKSFSMGQYSQALNYYLKALNEPVEDPDRLGDLYGNMGNVYGITGQMDEAVRFYEKAIEILRRQEDFGRLGSTFVNIGNLYSDRGELDPALSYYKKGLLLLEKEQKWDDLSTLYGNLSLLSLRQSDLSLALDYAHRSLEAAKRLKHPARMADALHRLAKAKDAEGRIKEARRFSELAYDHYSHLRDDMGSAMTLYHQASLYEKEGDLRGAIDCLYQVVAVDEKYKLPKLAENKEKLSNLRSRLRSASRAG